jgi:hypothetical protein
VLREFLTLVRSLIMMEMPKPALVRGVMDQDLPGSSRTLPNLSASDDKQELPLDEIDQRD